MRVRVVALEKPPPTCPGKLFLRELAIPCYANAMRVSRLVAVCLVLAGIAACTPPMPISYRGSSLSPDASGPKPLPHVKRKAIDGREVDTDALRGRVVVVKFFAKFCEPCKKTLPFVEAYAKAHPEVAVVGVSEDEAEADVKELVAQYGLSFPVVQDGGHAVSGRFRVSELPMVLSLIHI